LKAEADSSSRSQKDFICREEKRKAAWGMQRYSETSGPLARLEIGFYSLFKKLLEGRDVSLVQTFPGKEKCLLG
jgi:hypothetical protein